VRWAIVLAFIPILGVLARLLLWPATSSGAWFLRIATGLGVLALAGAVGLAILVRTAP
jgi:hypothetical protein